MCHVATAFAKQSNRKKIIACASSIGPGAANMVTACATATVNNIPLLVFPADTFASRQPDPVLQQLEQSSSLASQFGMPYVLTAEPRSYDKATLNYNWQMRGTEAFSVYSGVTDTINGESANQAVSSVLRFLTRMGVIRYNCHAGYISTIMDEEDLLSIRSEHAAGFFKKLVQPGDEVVRGDIIANIINPMTGENTTDIYAPTDGIIFYCQNSPMIYQNSVIFKMIRRLHN